MPGSSSSSDEEEDLRIRQLREVAVSFDSLKQCDETEKPSSKRHQECSEDPNSFEVTPEFQEFVAKKLRKKLDESIELITNFSNKYENKSKQDDFKFELLKNVYVSDEMDKEIKKSDLNKKSNNKKERKSKKEESDSDEEHLNMLKEAAIDVNFLAKTTCIKQHKKIFLSSIKNE